MNHESNILITNTDQNKSQCCMYKNNSNLLYLNAHYVFLRDAVLARFDFLLASLSKASCPLFSPWLYKTMTATLSSSFLWQSSQWANTQKACRELDALQQIWTGVFVLTLYSTAVTAAFGLTTNIFPQSLPLHLFGKLGFFFKYPGLKYPLWWVRTLRRSGSWQQFQRLGDFGGDFGGDFVGDFGGDFVGDFGGAVVCMGGRKASVKYQIQRHLKKGKMHLLVLGFHHDQESCQSPQYY